jgi:plasmid stability protein
MEPSNTRTANPMALTVHLPNDVERRLRERASREGQSLEESVLHLIERDASRDALAAMLGGGAGEGPVVDASGLRAGGGSALSDNQFELLLDELASGPGLPNLPADFSRAHIYADHD